MIQVSKYKTLLVIIVLLFLFSCKKEILTEINYETQSVGDDINVQSITFINNDVGFACGGKKGDVGTIYKTINGGTNWQKIFSISNNGLYNVCFVNDTLGFACGENLLLLKTIDGGLNWVNQYQFQGHPPSSYNSTLRNIFAFDANTIYVAGGTDFMIGVTYKTYDGGNLWIYNTFDNEMRSTFFTNKYTGYFASYGAIFKTTDSAYSFNRLPIDDDFFVSIDFANANIGFACGYNGGIYKTIDGGNSWTSQSTTNTDISRSKHFNQLKFLNENIGYAVGNDGLIMFTDNGGANWNTAKKITDNHLYAIYIKNSSSIFVTSTNGKIFLLKK